MLESPESFVPGSKSGSLLFTYEHLRKKDLDFFRSLPISDVISLGGVTFEIAHASMEDDRYYFEGTDPQTEALFPQMCHSYLLTGHSHRQYIRCSYGKTILNPGSVGIPQGGSIWPKYAIIEIVDGSVSCSLQEVQYEIQDVIHAQFRSGLVERGKYWAIGVLYDLITGTECVLKLLKLVEASGRVHDEAVWHYAAIQLGMRLTEEEIINFYREITTSGHRPSSQ